MKTIVVFRKFKDQGDIVALFPAEVNYPNGDCGSYQHVGQHGAANYNHCMKTSVAATSEEYQALKKELESIGYVFKIQKRYSVSKFKIAA